MVNALPRNARRFPNAIVWVDGAGNLNVEVVCGGSFYLEQDALGFLQVNTDELEGD